METTHMCRMPQRGASHWRGRYDSLAFVRRQDDFSEQREGRLLSTLAHVSCFGDLQPCGLSASGICLPQNEASTAAGLITSNDSSYCSATDPRCASCSPPLNTSSICIGSDGCMCLSACEGPGWREFATEQLLRSASSQLRGHEACLLPKAGAKAPLADDSCAWDPTRSHPRSCYDCLNSPLASGQVRSCLPSRELWLASCRLTRWQSGLLF